MSLTGITQFTGPGIPTGETGRSRSGSLLVHSEALCPLRYGLHKERGWFLPTALPDRFERPGSTFAGWRSFHLSDGSKQAPRAGIGPANLLRFRQALLPTELSRQRWPIRNSNPGRESENLTSWSPRRMGHHQKAAESGLEPLSPGSEPGILPLDDSAVQDRVRPARLSGPLSQGSQSAPNAGRPHRRGTTRAGSR